MSRRVARCTQAEINRAAKVAKAQGMAVRITIDGEIWIVDRPIGVMFEGERGMEVERPRRIVF